MTIHNKLHELSDVMNEEQEFKRKKHEATEKKERIFTEIILYIEDKYKGEDEN